MDGWREGVKRERERERERERKKEEKERGLQQGEGGREPGITGPGSLSLSLPPLSLLFVSSRETAL